MTEEELILNYLSRYYTINNNKFYNIETQCVEYGAHIIDSLTNIFAVSEVISSTFLIQWGVNQGLSEEQITQAWTKITPISFEFKKTNRFISSVSTIFNINTWVVSSISRPSMVIKKIKLFGIIIHKKIKWNPIVLTLIDPIYPSSSQRLMDYIKNKKIEKFNFSIESLDSTGQSIEKWNIINANILNVDFGELAYSNDNIVECKILISVGDVSLI